MRGILPIVMSTRDTDAAARFLRDDAPPPEGVLLGRIALELHLLSHDQLQGALRYLDEERAKGRELQLGQVLLKFRYLTAEDLGRVLEEQRRRQETATTIPNGGCTQIGSYEIVEEIGRGAMGFVYKAFDPKLKRTVALKTVREDRCDAAFLERFQREAVALARLHHPGIVTLYEAGMHRGLPFVAMELVEGRSLEERLRRGRMPFDNAARIAEAAARAVHHAHGEGVIHRDLKPGNILLDHDDHPRIVDFGLARVETDRIAMTMSGDVLGTPAYMSPEQVKGARKLIDARTDVYALGAILYEMVTGRMPFSGRTAAELFEKILRSEPTPPRRFRTIPRDLEVICLKAMSKEPERRYGSAELFAEDLRRFQAGEPILARPPSVWYRIGTGLRRRQAPVIAASAVLVAALGTWGVVRAIRSRSAREAEKRQVALQHEIDRQREDARNRATPFVEEINACTQRMRQLVRMPDQDLRQAQDLLDRATEQYEAALKACPDFPEAYLGMARLLRLVSKGRDVLDCLSRALAIRSDYAPAYLERALLSVDNAERTVHWNPGFVDREVEVVREDLRKVLAHSKDDRDRLMAEALLAYLQPDYPRAEQLLRRLAEGLPDSFETLLWLGHTLAHGKKFSEAKAVLRKAQELHRHHSIIDLYLGWVLVDSHEYPQAVDELSRVIEAAPSNFAYILRGQSHHSLRKYDEAVVDYTKAIELASNSAQAYMLRGGSHLELGNAEQAFLDASKAISLDATLAHAYYYRATARQGLGGVPQESIGDLSKAIEFAPSLAEPYLARGYIYLELVVDLDRAVSDFSKAIELAPHLCQALNNRAWAYHRKGEYARAVEDCTRAITVHPEDAAHFYTRARTHGAMGNHKEAVADYDQALHLKPQDDAALIFRADSRRILGDLEGAVADTSLVADRSPNNERAFCIRGWCRHGLKQYANARKDFDRAIELNPDCSNAYAGRAQVRLNTADSIGAREDVQQALKRNPPDSQKQELEQLLKWLEGKE